MSLRDEFIQAILEGLENNYDLLELRSRLDVFRKRGMTQRNMIEVLEALRVEVKAEDEDIILDLLDFVVGFCNSELSIFG